MRPKPKVKLLLGFVGSVCSLAGLAPSLVFLDPSPFSGNVGGGGTSVLSRFNLSLLRNPKLLLDIDLRVMEFDCDDTA